MESAVVGQNLTNRIRAVSELSEVWKQPFSYLIFIYKLQLKLEVSPFM